tara:strand:- start:19948 stop:20073 length:126 start_codon:yes stop_codon:yes gene_type:complete
MAVEILNRPVVVNLLIERSQDFCPLNLISIKLLVKDDKFFS